MTDTGTSDYFNCVIGLIEDIVISDEFQVYMCIQNIFSIYFSVSFFQNLQQDFMEKYYKEFDHTEENKIVYTNIFEVYTSSIESYIVGMLNSQMNGTFDMEAFVVELM